MYTGQSRGDSRKPRVVIIGGGFGGLNAAKALRSAPVNVTVVDRVNHHLFQPLLYQVATAGLAPSDITAPIRWILRRQRNTEVLLGEVTRVDPATSTVQVQHENGSAEIGFDFLVIASGSRHAYFGHEEWEPFAPGLKSLDDALGIRSRFLKAFELAEWERDDEARKRLQTFVIVGGGPTGVELAGILPEIARRAMRNDFRNLNPEHTRVVLIEAGPRLLPTFAEETSRRVLADLTELGVEVRTGAAVTHISSDTVFIGDEKIIARNVFWAAGNRASPLARTLGVPLDSQGRVAVEKDLSVPGHSNIFVVGDLAAVTQDGALVPGVAQGAIQGGRAAGNNIVRTLRGEPRKKFRYWDKGNAATIGRNKAIVELGTLTLSGRPAWLFWLFLHILYLTGFRNRLAVFIDWAFAYLSYERGARIITGHE